VPCGAGMPCQATNGPSPSGLLRTAARLAPRDAPRPLTSAFSLLGDQRRCRYPRVPSPHHARTAGHDHMIGVISAAVPAIVASSAVPGETEVRRGTPQARLLPRARSRVGSPSWKPSHSAQAAILRTSSRSWAGSTGASTAWDPCCELNTNTDRLSTRTDRIETQLDQVVTRTDRVEVQLGLLADEARKYTASLEDIRERSLTAKR